MDLVGCCGPRGVEWGGGPVAGPAAVGTRGTGTGTGTGDRPRVRVRRVTTCVATPRPGLELHGRECPIQNDLESWRVEHQRSINVNGKPQTVKTRFALWTASSRAEKDCGVGIIPN